MLQSGGNSKERERELWRRMERWLMSDELEKIWKEAVVAYLNYYSIYI
jgi:hypothetical protein